MGGYAFGEACTNDRAIYGLNLPKNVMQLHWVDAETDGIQRKRVSRAKLAKYFAALKPVRIVLEACRDAPHWARVLSAQRHQVGLLPAKQVKPFVSNNKGNAADAEAIWIAGQQDDIRRVPIKTCEQQAVTALHRTRCALMVRTAHHQCAAWPALRVQGRAEQAGDFHAI